jgi:hypothetical protein
MIGRSSNIRREQWFPHRRRLSHVMVNQMFAATLSRDLATARRAAPYRL